ncbi:MAG: thymidine kinase [Flavobacteriales bacterium]|nr:thymidine kinase [Flavobacteriales bacterium]
MFTEPQKERGWIEVICGSMFSGKTEELIRRVKRANIANRQTMIFKPAIDVRYAEHEVVSHDRNSLESIPVEQASDILSLSVGCDVVAIDEAQFFDERIVEICVRLARDKVRVIVAGLDMDFRGNPFGPMPGLLSIAEYVTKVHAICMQCGDIASHTYKKIINEQTVELGERDLYEARCRNCFNEGMSWQRDQMKLPF